MANLTTDEKLIFESSSPGSSLVTQSYTATQDLWIESNGSIEAIADRDNTDSARAVVFLTGANTGTTAVGIIHPGGHFTFHGNVVVLGASARVKLNTTSNIWSIVTDANTRKLRFLRNETEYLVISSNLVEFKEKPVEFNIARLNVSELSSRLKTLVHSGTGTPTNITSSPGRVVLRTNATAKSLLCYDGTNWHKVDLVED